MEMSDRKFTFLLFVLACAFIGLALLTSCGGYVPPVKPPTPPPSQPSPMCQNGVLYGCWVEPSAGKYEYVCPVKDASGFVIGTQNVAQPSLCPQQPRPPEPVVDTFCSKGKLIGTFHPYLGGLDSTWVCQGDHEFCASVGLGWWADGRPRYDCALGPDLSALRNQREQTLGCPAWEFRESPSAPWQRCTETQHPTMSCTHFDLYNVPPYGCQPATGFYVRPHGNAEMRFRSLKSPAVVSDAQWVAGQ